MIAGNVFDPFFNVAANLGNNLEPRNLINERRANPQNTLGIVGSWFTIDGNITSDMLSWGTTPQNRWPENKGLERVYTTCLQIGGVDGIIGSYDDRILMAGGGNLLAPSEVSRRVLQRKFSCHRAPANTTKTELSPPVKHPNHPKRCPGR